MRENGWALPWRINAGSYSTVGKVREHNEDYSRIDLRVGLFAVADGLGGHNAGEVASGLAIDIVNETLRNAFNSGRAVDSEVLLDAFGEANRQILEEAEDPDREGMGTTLTAIVLEPHALLIGHVGDTRAWRVRDGEIHQLTQDHTVVAPQVRDGVLSLEDAAIHPMRNLLSRCLGVSDELEVDMLTGDVAAGDVYVMASDGMSPSVDADEIAEVVGEASDAAAACRTLVDRACDRDGHDNITVVVVMCEDV